MSLSVWVYATEIRQASLTCDGNSVSPYVGFGWGDPAGSPACREAQSDLASEEAKLRHEADILRWYPMVSLGIGLRF